MTQLLGRTAVRPRLESMWHDIPDDPGRLPLDDPRVERLVKRHWPHSETTDLGGALSLNVHIEAHDLVLRVHMPFVTRNRLRSVQELRAALKSLGLAVPAPVPLSGRLIFRCGDRIAELEPYLKGTVPQATSDSYEWLFTSIGQLHSRLDSTDIQLVRPAVSTFAAPSTMLRWICIGERRLLNEPEALQLIARFRKLVLNLQSNWIPARELPHQIIHGDARPGNFLISDGGGETIFLDFGFTAYRPRAHELAYSLAYMVHAIADVRRPDLFDWTILVRMVKVYEDSSGLVLSDKEWIAIGIYMAAVPLYHASSANLLLRPISGLRAARPFTVLSEQLLDEPDIRCY